MNPRLIDAHAHMQFPAYDADREEVIQRALAARVWVVNAGSSLMSSEQAIHLAEKYDAGVYATAGIHPSYAKNNLYSKYQGDDMQSVTSDISEDRDIEDFNEEKMRSLIQHPKCVAIGECGLEYFPDTLNKSLQAELFIKHIELSYELKKPLVIHCRDAYSDLYDILIKYQNKLVAKTPALMHFFSGTESDALKFLELGCVFSFGGAITLPAKSGKTDFISLIKKIPLDAMFLETDCPYVSPSPIRGRRNEPINIFYIAEKIAEIKGTTAEKVAEATTNNAMKFFAINKACC